MKTWISLSCIGLATLMSVGLVIGAETNSDGKAESTPPPPPTSVSSAVVSSTPDAAPAPVKQAQELGNRAATPGLSVTYQAEQVVKMKEQGVEAPVIRSYVENAANIQPPSADEIIYLHQHGIAPEIITALIKHGSETQMQAAKAGPGSQAGMMPPTPAPQPEAPVYAPVPQSQLPAYSYSAPPTTDYPYTYPGYDYSYASYPGYTYTYPYSTYPYWWYNYGYYTSPFFIGFNFNRHFSSFRQSYPYRNFHGSYGAFPRGNFGRSGSIITHSRPMVGPPRPAGGISRAMSYSRPAGGFSRTMSYSRPAGGFSRSAGFSRPVGGGIARSGGGGFSGRR